METEPETSHLSPDEAVLLESFRRGDFAPGGFGHREHVKVAWLYQRCLPREEALERFVADLKRLVAVLGAEGKYHETITWTYLLLIRERREIQGPAASWEEFSARNRDLLEHGAEVLERYYRPETLRSELARRVFVLPDRGLAASA